MTEEKLISKLHEKNYVHLAGNATAGLYLTLKALGINQKKIAIPNSICFNVPAAIYYSDNIPIFLDISMETLGLSTSSLEKNIDSVDVVLAVHSYGSICDIEKIRAICSDRNKLLIEDFAVAQGARVNRQPVGSFGYASIVSFGAGKIINIGHGGAVLSDDKSFIDEIKHIENDFSGSVQHKTKDIENLAQSFKAFYNSDYGTNRWGYNEDFIAAVSRCRESFFFKFDDEWRDSLKRSLVGLDDNIAQREARAELLQNHFDELSPETVTCFIPPVGSVYWRYNIFLSANRDRLLKKLLRAKHCVSSWYPSLNRIFLSPNAGPAGPTTFYSDKLSDTILNICVDEKVDRRQLSLIISEIERFLDNTQKMEEDQCHHS